jgi:acetyl/propionyl-CoA carboxylase alpha subunit
VKEQIRIAEGHPLSFRQEDISIHGHAIELRIYAEDPHNNFLPDPGKLLDYSIPRGPGVRVDDSYESGLQVPVDYDPLIAKLIVYGIDREEAIQRMKRAIREYRINGVRNTLHFGYLVLNHEQFVSGKYTTHFIDDHFLAQEKVSLEDQDEMTVAAALAGKLFHKGHKDDLPFSSSVNTLSKWKNRR